MRYGGPDAAPVTTDGPLPETSDLVAGWYMIDVESHERAVELAAHVSSEPGPGGEPLHEWIDVGEDALQEALVQALRVWPGHPPRDPRAWLTTVATRRPVDLRRSEAARHRREEATRAPASADEAAATEEGDDTLFLMFCCRHPDLAPASQVALTLRAVGGLTTREIADAFLVPEATTAQRTSRAERALRGRRLDRPGDLAVVLRVLHLVYAAGHAGRVDLAGEAIRLARQLTLVAEEPESRGLLAPMLLHHARLPALYDPQGRIVPLDRQDRGLWDTGQIAEGVRVLQSALAAHVREAVPATGGWRVADAPSARGAIVGLAPTGGADPAAVRAALLEHRVTTTASPVHRAPREMTGPLLRLAPHVDADPDALTAVAQLLTTL